MNPRIRRFERFVVFSFNSENVDAADLGRQTDR